MTLLTVHETPDNGATTRGVCYLRGFAIEESSLSILPSEVAHGDVAPRARALKRKRTRDILVSVEPRKEGQR